MGQLFRKRDFALLVVLCIVIYLGLDTGTFNYNIEPVWYYDMSKAQRNHRVAPIITDLNGDGQKEIIIITNDNQLKVLDGNNKEMSNDIYTLQEIASVRLNNINFQQGKTPVAMKTGYIEHYDVDKERNQIIVIVREDWTVSCYNSNLRLLWEKAVAHKTHEIDMIINKYMIDDVAVTISPISLQEGSSGIVIVGASMSIRNESFSQVSVEHGLDLNEDGAVEHVDLDIRSALEHFSVYALNAANGHVLWRHDGLDIKPEQYSKSLPQHAYKLDARDLITKTHHGAGINHWGLFKQSFLSELPHDWHGNTDTTLKLAQFNRQHLGATTVTKEKKTPRKTGRILNLDSSSLPLSATLPHDAAEHIEHPNVVVAHTKNGLEVISLKSGSPVTSLSLVKGNSYADIDGDGVIDTILVLETKRDVALHGDAFAHDEGKLQHCSIMVISGLPAQAQLFNGTICSNRMSLQDPMVNINNNKIPAEIAATSPLVLQRLNPKTQEVDKVKDVIIAINIGIITCYDGNGKYLWQVKNAPTWSVDRSQIAALSLFDVDAVRVDEVGSHDNIRAQLLLVGDNALGLYNRDGDLLVKAQLPKKPSSHPILGDFNSDGVSDIIIITDNALLGYKVEVIQSVRVMFITGTLVLILCVITFLTNIKYDSGHESKDGSKVGSSVVSNRFKKHILSIVRSTDEYHLD